MASFDSLTFITDYGLEDGFVAACHGVAARIAPSARVIDITHLVQPGDVRRGAAVLAQTIPYLPPAVHVAVVDPGVGTARRGVAVQAGDSVLVGPDNGLLSWAIDAKGGPERAVLLTNGDLWLHPVSPTFHGRDIFMPVAAHLAAGAELSSAGDELDVADLVTLPAPTSRVRDGEAEGEVMSVDRFGNVQLSIVAADVEPARRRVRLPARGPLRPPPAHRAVPGNVRGRGAGRDRRVHRQRRAGVAGRQRRRRGAAARASPGRARAAVGGPPGLTRPPARPARKSRSARPAGWPTPPVSRPR